MPVKFSKSNVIKGDSVSRIDALRKTIPNDEGMNDAEVAEKTQSSTSHVRKIISEKGWGLRIAPPNGKSVQMMLVNPQTLEKYSK